MIAKRTSDDSDIKITVKLVESFTANENRRIIGMLNVIFKKCLRRIGYTEFGKNRDYFDFDHLIRLNQYNLAIAAGYRANINAYDDGARFLLNVEASHKLMNHETVLDVIMNIFNQYGPNEGKDKVVQELVGKQVMTGYKNKTLFENFNLSL
jgi:hypothetical protein